MHRKTDVSDPTRRWGVKGWAAPVQRLIIAAASRVGDSALPIDYPAVRHHGFVGLSAAEAIASIVEIQAEIKC
jgi:hypothetical protein